MHPLRQCKTIHIAGHVYVRKQHIDRDMIQNADCLSGIGCLNDLKARVAQVASRCQTQKNVVFYDQHNRHGRRLHERHGLPEASLIIQAAYPLKDYCSIYGYAYLHYK